MSTSKWVDSTGNPWRFNPSTGAWQKLMTGSWVVSPLPPEGLRRGDIVRSPQATIIETMGPRGPEGPRGPAGAAATSLPWSSITGKPTVFPVDVAAIPDGSIAAAKMDATIQASLAAIAGMYTKPGTGIPATDLAAAVQASLGRADTALQSAPVTSVASKTGAVTLVRADVGLGNVDNTSDLNKPVSTATATALSGKVDASDSRLTDARTPTDGSVTTAKVVDGAITSAKLSAAVQASLGLADTAVQAAGLTKAAVGLGNVDNTSNATERAAAATLTNKTISGASNTLTDIPESAVTNLTTDLAAKESAANKGQPGGYASLDGSGTVPAIQLPSYVDDVLEYANLAALPVTGTTGKIFVTLDTNKTYRWSGSSYIEISASPGSTDAVAEGTTNLYYTNARADARIASAIGVSVQPYNASLVSWAGKTPPAGAVVGDSDAQTLTNKTLTAPKIDTIKDSSGAVQLGFSVTASAVNYAYIGNAAALGNVTIGTTGSDSALPLWIAPKGTGSMYLYAPTGLHPTIGAQGADANHNLNLVSKGTGTVKANGIDVVTTTATQTLTNKNLAGAGNTFPTFNQSTTGSAATLTTGRTVATNLASTTAATFDGSANITPGVTGVLPVSNGGTGASTLTGLVKGTGTTAMVAAVAGTDYLAPGGALGTPSSGTLTNATGLPVAGISATGTASSASYLRGDGTWSVSSPATITDPPVVTHSTSATSGLSVYGRQTLGTNFNGVGTNLVESTPAGRGLINDVGTWGDNVYAWEWETVHTGTVLEVKWCATFKSDCWQQIFIDDVPLTSAPVKPSGSFTLTTLSDYYTKLTFATVGPRKIRFRWENCAFKELRTNIVGDVRATDSKKPLIAFVTTSNGGYDPISSTPLYTSIGAYPWKVADALGVNCAQFANNGGGYVASQRYGDTNELDPLTAVNPDFIVVEGSNNDQGQTYATINAAAAAYYAALATRLPNTPVLVVGPLNTMDGENNTTNGAITSAAIKSAALAAPNVVAYVDPNDNANAAGTLPPIYANATAYTTNQAVRYQGGVYRALSSFTSATAAPDMTLWRQTSWSTGTGGADYPANDGTRDVLFNMTHGHSTPAGQAAYAYNFAREIQKYLLTPQTKLSSLAATGTRSSSTFLCGNGTWATPAGGGGSAGGMLAPVQHHCDGTLTYTIVGGSITQISGTQIQYQTVSVGDRILILSAPPSGTTGVGTEYTFTSSVANGIYVVTAVGTNMSVSRAADMSGSANPTGLTVFSENKNAGWGAQSLFTVSTPFTAASFTYGTTPMQFIGSGGRNLNVGSLFVGGEGRIGWWNNTPSIVTYLNVNSTAPSGSTQQLTLPAVTTGTLLARVVATLATTLTLGSAAGTEYVYLLQPGAAPTLPTAVGNAAFYRIKNTTGAPIGLGTTSGQTVDGSASPIIIRPGVSIDIVSDGANWFVL